MQIGVYFCCSSFNVLTALTLFAVRLRPSLTGLKRVFVDANVVIASLIFGCDVKTPHTVPHSTLTLTSCLGTASYLGHTHTPDDVITYHHTCLGSCHTDPLYTKYQQSDHDWQSSPLSISFRAEHVHTVRAPWPKDKARPSNLPVSRDAPTQSQHKHSAGRSQPTTTLRSGEYSVPHFPVFFWSSRPYPSPGQS